MRTNNSRKGRHRSTAWMLVVVATSLLMTSTLLSTTARASLDVRVDLATLVGSTAGNWNNISDGSLNAVTGGLIDFNTGLATATSISGAGWRPFFGVDVPASWPDKDWVVSSSVWDGAGLDNGQTGTFRFSGLNSSSTYRIEVVSARTTFDYLDTITVDGALADRTFNGTAVVTPWGATTDGLIPQNWLIWDNLSAASGTFVISATASTSTLGILNAIRIVETDRVIPEPASIAIWGIGLTAVGLIRRRRTVPKRVQLP